MPRKERTRRPGADQLDLTVLLADTTTAPGDEDAAQGVFTGAADRLAATMGDQEEQVWEASPYGWLRHVPAVRRSRVAERMVAAYLATAGVLVAPATGSGHSFVVGQDRVKVRLSLRWAEGDFRFQQVEHGSFDRIVLLGLAPQLASVWVMTADDLAGHVDTSTGWLSFPAVRPPAWLDAYGPHLLDLAARLT